MTSFRVARFVSILTLTLRSSEIRNSSLKFAHFLHDDENDEKKIVCVERRSFRAHPPVLLNPIKDTTGKSLRLAE